MPNRKQSRLGIGKDEMSGHGFRAMARTILDEVLGMQWNKHYEICQKHNISFTTIEMRFNSEDEAMYWCWTSQKNRN